MEKHKWLKHFRTMWGAQLSLQPIAQDLCANGSWGRSVEFLTRPLRWTKLSYAECAVLQNSHNTSALSIRNIWGSMYFRPHFIVLKKLCSMHKLQTLPILVNYTDTEELNVSLLLTEVIQVFQHVCSRQSSHMKPNTVCHRSLSKPSAILSNLLPAQNQGT